MLRAAFIGFQHHGGIVLLKDLKLSVELVYPKLVQVYLIGKDAGGCQDTVTLKLTINSGLHTDTLVTACKQFTWNRTGQTYTTSQNVDYIFTNAGGCQDTVTLKLTINSGLHTDTVVTACKQFTWNRTGQTYTTSQNVDYIFTNAGGCQDTVTLKLTINSGVEIVRDTAVCQSQLPFTWNGIQVTAAGNYPFTTKNAAGCDSTITLRVTVNPPTFSITAITICENQVPYTWNGINYTTSGTYIFITKNAAGCDSTATLQLTITQTIRGPIDSTTICANALPYQWNGITITAAGTYTKTMQSVAGCDSIATVVVATQPLATATISGGNPICVGQSTTISITLTGTAPWALTYTDGSASYTVTGIMSSPYVLTVSPGVTTTYSLTNLSDVKCTNNSLNSSVTVTVSTTVSGIRYPNVAASANVAKQLEARNMGSGHQYSWSPPTGLNYTDVRTPIFKNDKTVEYLITISPTNGCRIVDTLKVEIVTGDRIRSSLHVPNAWSPNNDGSNDKLFPLTINIKELYYFRVFNRWGQLMFETNKLGDGWDGIYNGKPQVQDVYTWTVEAIGLDGVYYKKSGNSILLR